MIGPSFVDDRRIGVCLEDRSSRVHHRASAERGSIVGGWSGRGRTTVGVGEGRLWVTVGAGRGRLLVGWEMVRVGEGGGCGALVEVGSGVRCSEIRTQGWIGVR